MDRDLLASLLQPSDGRAVRLVEEIVARCWPGGAGDRTQPAAREWLRRWAPKQLPLRPPVCSCPAGRCSACN
jgi:hypothetical protein